MVSPGAGAAPEAPAGKAREGPGAGVPEELGGQIPQAHPIQVVPARGYSMVVLSAPGVPFVNGLAEFFFASLPKTAPQKGRAPIAQAAEDPLLPPLQGAGDGGPVHPQQVGDLLHGAALVIVKEEHLPLPVVLAHGHLEDHSFTGWPTVAYDERAAWRAAFLHLKALLIQSQASLQAL